MADNSMIDYSREIFSWLSLSLKSEYPEIKTASIYDDQPAKFPAVTIVQMDNAVLLRTRDANIENHVSVMYQIDIYTNGQTDKQQQAEYIRNTVNELMQSKGFQRSFCQPVPNLQDRSIYRISMRFIGIIGRDGFVYQR